MRSGIARAISIRTGKAVEFSKLDRIIGALLGAKQANLKSQVGKARALGQAFDINCLSRFTALLSEIKNTPLHEHVNFKVAAHVFNKAFFESYFSNYIEGTVFQVSEAESIVFEKKFQSLDQSTRMTFLKPIASSKT